ncbi:MAG: PTS sugar transporter subunit IIA [Candidatus Hydrogenedentota bacterium]
MNAFGKEIPNDAICIFPEGTTKGGALNTMIDAICNLGVVGNRESFEKALYERESIRSTGFKGVAIPHVRIDEISEPTVGVGISKSGIDFDSLDNDTVSIIVLFAMPSGSDKEYLSYLAKAMMALRSEGFCEKLLECTTNEEVVAVLADHD